MEQYLKVAGEIYNWLANLQVQQTRVDTSVENGHFCFTLNHPVHGKIDAQQPCDTTGVFDAHGIALRVKSGEQIEVLDDGGIYDPIDKRVQGEHYSTSHFALLGALLFQQSGDENYLQQVKKAVAFHLRTAPTEYQPVSQWMYHWDFQNYAFVMTYKLVKDCLSADERRTWQGGLKSWRTNHRNKLTNWAAMRAWAYVERFTELRNPFDMLRLKWNMRYVAMARSSDGCFDDNVGLSRPIQYHIFTVAILHRIYMLNGNGRLRQWVGDGVEYFMPFIDPAGDFNYLGRGHEQIFGYGAAIYALEAGYRESGDTRFLAGATRIFDYMMHFKRADHFPLVLNDLPDQERPGWYDYHHLTVYNAFLGVWLAMAASLSNKDTRTTTKRKAYTWFSEPTQTAIVSKNQYHAVFYGGLEEYLCEAAITPHHLWWNGLGDVFSCPGGPTPDRFGQRTPPDQNKNLFAPIAKNSRHWYLPCAKPSSQFELEGDRIRMTFDYGPFNLYRTVIFKDDALVVNDTFEFTRSECFQDFRLFNVALAIDRYAISLTGGEHLVVKASGQELYVHFPDADIPLEALEVTTSAKGKVQAFSKRRLNFTPAVGDKMNLSFTITGNKELPVIE